MIKIKVFGVNGKSREMTATTLADIFKISKCYARWVYI